MKPLLVEIKNSKDFTILKIKNTKIGISKEQLDNFNKNPDMPFIDKHGMGQGLNLARKLTKLIDSDFKITSDGKEFVEIKILFKK
jgi:hypothetical protein